MKFKDKSKEVAKEVAISKAQNSGKESDFGFRARKNGKMVGVVTAQPDGTYRTKEFKK